MDTVTYQSCSVYFRPSEVVVLSEDRTVSGLLIANSEGSVLLSPSDEDLTTAIKNALSVSKWNVPQPNNPLKMEVPEWVHSRKIASWNALEKGAQLCGVQLTHDELIIEINKPYKAGGFLVEVVEKHPKTVLDNVGEMLRKRITSAL